MTSRNDRVSPMNPAPDRRPRPWSVLHTGFAMSLALLLPAASAACEQGDENQRAHGNSCEAMPSHMTSISNNARP